MKFIGSFLVALLGLSTTYADQQPAPSKEMRAIVAERFAAGPNLSTNGLKQLRFDDLPQIEKLVRFEKYLVPGGPFVADAIEYEIWRSIDTGGYLVLHYGGEDGIREVHGVGVSV